MVTYIFTPIVNSHSTQFLFKKLDSHPFFPQNWCQTSACLCSQTVTMVQIMLSGFRMSHCLHASRHGRFYRRLLATVRCEVLPFYSQLRCYAPGYRFDASQVLSARRISKQPSGHNSSWQSDCTVRLVHGPTTYLQYKITFINQIIMARLNQSIC